MRILVWVFVLLAFFPCVNGEAVISIEDAQGNVGDNLVIPIIISGAKDMGSLDIQVGYDPRILKAVNVENSAMTESSILLYNIKEGVLAISIIDVQGINGDGEIALASFDVIGEGMSAMEIKANANDVNSFIDIIITTRDGSVTAVDSGLSAAGFAVLAAVGLMALAGASRRYWQKRQAHSQ